MPSAPDAKEWAASGGLHGIGNSLYTPFSGTDGDDIDLDAYRALVRYCVGDLGHSMLWLTSGIAEWWSLTMDERKQLVEVAIEEARAIAPDTVIQACTSATSAKDCVELTQHAEAAGADICYLQTPPMEVHGGEGVLRFFQYVADRTDIALGMFNSPSSGYVLTPEEVARIATEVPAVCATKEGTLEHWRSKAAHALRTGPRDLGVRRDRVPRRLVAAGHRRAGAARDLRLPARDARPADPHRLLEPDLGRSARRGDRARTRDRPRPGRRGGRPTGTSDTRDAPTTSRHWGEAFRYAAAVVGLPMGDYPHSRPPQAILPEVAKEEIRALYESVGFAKQLTNV